jgi:hypothetical protein
MTAGSSNGRTGRSERSDVGSIPAPAIVVTEVIRPWMRSLSRKQVRVTPLWVRVPRLPLFTPHPSPLSHEGRGEFDGPVVQRQRLLAYTQATAVQVRPGLLSPKTGQETRPTK